MAAKATLKEIKPEDVVFDDRNLNRHTEKGKELVEKSFSELGAGRSGVSDRNGKMIAGNLSVETAIAKGLKIVEVETEGDAYVIVKRKDLDLDSKTDNRARKLALADNSTAAVSLDWDFEEMKAIEADFGFEVGEWGIEIPEETIAPEVEEDNYEPKAEVETDIVPGDIFEFKKGGIYHRLMCGNSLDSDAVERLMNGTKAKLLVTDPPYEIDFDYTNTMLFCENANVFVFNNDRAQIRQLANSPLEFKKFFVFHHPGCAIPQEGGNEAFLDHILVSHETMGEALRYNKGDGVRTVIKGEYRRSDFHKHEKPFVVLGTLITAYSNEGYAVLDFFSGGGSLFSACHQLNRHCYGMELDPANCQTIVNRLIALDPEIKVTKNGEKLA